MSLDEDERITELRNWLRGEIAELRAMMARDAARVMTEVKLAKRELARLKQFYEADAVERDFEDRLQ